MARPTRRLEGQRFGRLLALRQAGRTEKRGHVLWRCKCDCGTTPIVSAKHLIQGNTKSCGCLKRSFDHHRALELWQRKVPASKIAREIGGNRNTVFSMIAAARARGDQRAVRRRLTFLPMPSGRAE